MEKAFKEKDPHNSIYNLIRANKTSSDEENKEILSLKNELEEVKKESISKEDE